MSGPKELSKEQFVDRLVEAGWGRAEAEREYETMLEEAAIEDGYDGP